MHTIADYAQNTSATRRGHAGRRAALDYISDPGNWRPADCRVALRAAILERAANQSSGWAGLSPIAWIYVFWCLIGGVLGAVIARSRNRKTWVGALLGVLLADPAAELRSTTCHRDVESLGERALHDVSRHFGPPDRLPRH